MNEDTFLLSIFLGLALIVLLLMLAVIVRNKLFKPTSLPNIVMEVGMEDSSFFVFWGLFWLSRLFLYMRKTPAPFWKRLPFAYFLLLSLLLSFFYIWHESFFRLQVNDSELLLIRPHKVLRFTWEQINDLLKNVVVSEATGPFHVISVQKERIMFSESMTNFQSFVSLVESKTGKVFKESSFKENISIMLGVETDIPSAGPTSNVLNSLKLFSLSIRGVAALIVGVVVVLFSAYCFYKYLMSLR